MQTCVPFCPSAVCRIVNVHRSLIKEDLIKLFADPTVLQQELDWRVIDNHGRQEEGVGSGVQRDILATFWQGIFASLTIGDVEKVPCIRHDHQKTEWEAICRVLCMAIALLDMYQFAYHQFSWPPVFMGKSLSARKTSLPHSCIMLQLMTGEC